jgi:hypothetical protein
MYYDPTMDRLYAPARRSAVLMFVVGAFMLLCGVCVGLAARLAPLDQLAAASGVNADQIAEIGMTPAEFMRFMYIIMAAGSLVLGILFGVLGLLLRKGGVASAVCSLVLVSLLVLFTLLQVVTTAVQVLSRREPAIGVALMISMAFLLLLAWLVISLIGAIRAAASIRAAQGQYAQQYWQMQQQAYQHGAYAGYGYAPPAPQQAPLQQAPLQPPPPPPPAVDPPPLGTDDDAQPRS